MSAMKSTVLVFLTTVSMVLSSLVLHYVHTLVLSETGLQNEQCETTRDVSWSSNVFAREGFSEFPLKYNFVLSVFFLKIPVLFFLTIKIIVYMYHVFIIY